MFLIKNKTFPVYVKNTLEHKIIIYIIHMCTQYSDVYAVFKQKKRSENS